ncbi:MAG TPA: hypothetical protein VK859_04450 [bacterium]|nr:hypothetical protein [bacterium]
MAAAVELQNQWEAFLKLLQVREARLHDHLKAARVKELTKYNLVVYAQNADDLKEMEVGLKVYHDKIVEFMPMIFRDSKGIKTELASEEDWKEFAPKMAPAAAPVATITVPADQNEMFKVLEASIRQKLEAEIRASLQEAVISPEAQSQMTQQLKEDLEQEEENRHLAIRMALIAEGDKILTQLVMVWQQSKQSGDGGAQWNEVKQRLLELLDATVQLTHS